MSESVTNASALVLATPDPSVPTLVLLAPTARAWGQAEFMDVDGVLYLLIGHGPDRAALAGYPHVLLVFGLSDVSLPESYEEAEALAWRRGAIHRARLVPAVSMPDVVMRVVWLAPADECDAPSSPPVVAWPAVGAVVRVRREEMGSVVMASRGDCAESLEDIPDIDFCCVPAVLVRTPATDDGGVLRWVQLSDLVGLDAETAGEAA